MTSPRVSILLPTHNRRALVRWAIDSALSQTLDDFELLVSGDGCTDDTGDLVRSYGDSRVVWFDWPKARGFGYANRNRTLRQARGTFIAYLADDDLWFPDHLARLTACLDANNAEWAYSRPLDVSIAGQITPKILNLHDARTRDMWLTQHVAYLPSPNVVHRRSCFERYGYWDEQIVRSGDWELWMRILSGGQWLNFAYEPTPTSLHFTADWRRAHANWRIPLWRRIRAWDSDQPPALNVAIPDGVPEQEVIARAMQQDPNDWVRQLRRAVDIELDQRAAFALPLSQSIEAGYWAFKRLTTGRKQFARVTESTDSR